MPFQDVPSDVNFISQEHDVLRFWKDTQAFNKLRSLRKGQPTWSFVDGPITANNPMGVHHGWGRTYKDVYNRFWGMRGRELRYQNGFDCQGLWVEVEVEKELGFKSKTDIEAYGLEAFVRRCKARVLKFSAVQTEQSIRLGYWMDWNDTAQLRALAETLMADPGQVITVDGPEGPVTDTVEQIVGRLGLAELGGSYYTFSTENNYMIWSFLKKCWEKGWLYRGADVMPWCPRCATGISQHEIVTDGYRELTHASVTLRLPLRERPGESLLVWTTTPWTLTSNVAAAVGPDLTYARIRNGEHVLYLSKGTLHMLTGPYELLGELQGREMAGWTYDGPFDELPSAQSPGGFHPFAQEFHDVGEASAVSAHRVILWDAVGEAEGTGIVHIAPGCGAEDFDLGKKHMLPIISPLNDDSRFIDGFGWLGGVHVAEVASPIFEDLSAKGILYVVEPYTHRYPTCWRCGTELVFRLVDEWFISMGESYDKPREEVTAEEKARSLRYQIMDVVDQIRWIPDFGHARELDWLRNMHDWMISKKRYWGLALPFWVCEQCNHHHVIGDERELQERAVAGWEDFAGHTPHRPHVDAVKLACDRCGGAMNRIPDVGNPWLDAGIVTFSTLQYRTNQEYWRKWYPADWISESFPGQFRNWFYSLLAMATVLDSSPPFLQNFGYASLLAEDGRQMHKSWGNSIEFNEAADKMGVDVMRWLYCAHKPENNLLFGYQRADDVRRRFLIPMWNVYNFFVTYARLDGWQPATPFDPAFPEGPTPAAANPLDRWILARLNQVVDTVTQDLSNSDAFGATLDVEGLIEDLTNWYVRRSRRRFWRSEADSDKAEAYATLYHVLVKLARAIAPIVPFVTEVIYQNLVIGVRSEARASVHHTDWPVADLAAADPMLLEQMTLARRITSLGLSARSAANLKVRQPLSRILVHVQEGRHDLSAPMVEIVCDELNIKVLEFVDDPGKLVTYKVLPNNRLLGPKLGKDFPAVRTALAALDPNAVARQVISGESLLLGLESGDVTLLPEEVLVQTEPAPGLAVTADKVLTIGIDATITAELRVEGLAREVVRRIQSMRKNAGFDIADHIISWYHTGSDELTEVMAVWTSYVQTETLSDEVIAGAPPVAAYVEDHKLDGLDATFGVLRASQLS